MSSQDPAPTPYATDLQLRWGDMDAYGHVNNVSFARLLETARVVALGEWFGEAGEGSLVTRGIVLVHQEIEYLAQLGYRPDPVRAHLWVTRVGGSSFTLGYELLDPPEVGTGRYLRAETTMTVFDLTTGSVGPLSESDRSVLAAHPGPEVAFRRRVGGER